MACEEARAMLDALMGGDRNAPLPKGAAIPGKRKNLDDIQHIMKRKKSCYDKDIDPLYTAWGIDCYDLFVNTKADIGTNPYVVDKGAHEEFINLPKQEQDRLGYNYFLFQKLSDLVRQCDRTIARNKEKLKQELNRKLSQRNYQDFVQDVDPIAIEQLTRDMILLEELSIDFQTKLDELQDVTKIENDRKQKLEPYLQSIRNIPSSTATTKIDSEESNQHLLPDATNENAVNDESDDQPTTSNTNNQPITTIIKQEDDIDQPPLGTMESAISTETTAPTTATEEPIISEEDRIAMDALQSELGQITLQKQKLVFEVARLISLIVPQNDTVDSQRRHLNYVKSDISTDKTICEVSGNNMSSRDADERIAAHYSGKQYVGWKLVRDKLQSMIQKYGRNGPPPPTGGREQGPSGASQHQQNIPPIGAGRGPYGSGGGGRDTFDRGGYNYRGNSGDRNAGSRDGWRGPSGRVGGAYNNDRRPPSQGDRGWRR